MPFTIVRQDITKMRVDAIVNAANTELAMGGGVCGAIFAAAGAEEMQRACAALAPIPTGGAAVTPGFALQCSYVIHAAGPIYSRYTPSESERLLRSAYTEALRLAASRGCESIAFPLISGGIYGYPKAAALAVASSAIRDFPGTENMEVYLTVFGAEAFAASRELMGRVESYIDEHYVELHSLRRRLLQAPEKKNAPPPVFPDTCALLPSVPKAKPMGLDKLLKDMDEPFSTALLRLIDAKGKSDVEVYKRANIDRKLFSKIRSGKGYLPGKRTALALAIALELTLPETDDLLKRLGYTLSHSQKFDVIIEYFIVNGEYDIFSINEVLFQYDLPLLGGS